MKRILTQISRENMYASPASKARFLWLFLAALLLPLVASLSRQSEYERNLQRDHAAAQEISEDDR